MRIEKGASYHSPMGYGNGENEKAPDFGPLSIKVSTKK
jgi:hypothetical protein